jgi:hypothetical protein
MNQGTQGYSLTKKTEGRKSRDTVSLKHFLQGEVCTDLKHFEAKPDPDGSESVP